MKKHSTLIMVIAAVILAFVAVRTSRTPAPGSMELAGQPVLPDLAAASIERVLITGPEMELEARRSDREWISPRHFGYPVDFARVRNIVRKLTDLKIGQQIDADPAVRARLKMYQPGTGRAPEETGSLVEFFDGNDRLLAALLIGGTRDTVMEDGSRGGWPDGRYVSPDGGESVYLVADALHEMPTSSDAWLQKDLLNIRQADISRITMIDTGGVDVVLERIDGSFKAVNIAENEETEDRHLFSVGGALSNLRMEDLADPAKGDTVLGFDNPARFIAQTADGTVYTALIGSLVEDTGKRYARFSVVMNEDFMPVAAADEETGEDALVQLAEWNEMTAAAEALNAHISRWTYVIPEHKANAMTHRRSDLVREKEASEDQE